MAVGGGTRGTLGSVVVWTCGQQRVLYCFYTVFRMYGCNIELTPGSTVHDNLTGSVGSEHMMDATG